MSFPLQKCTVFSLINKTVLFSRIELQASQVQHYLLRIKLLPILSVRSNSDQGVKVEESSGHKSSKRPYASVSGSARNVQKTMIQGQDGLEFILPISQTISNRKMMTVPTRFVYAYDMSGKKYVMLSTDKGNFRLDVRHYHRSKGYKALIVQFGGGWSEFYRKNCLSIGMKCLFKLKEHTVNGDASGFSMDVLRAKLLLVCVV